MKEYAEIYRALADGKIIQYLCADGNWIDKDDEDDVLRLILAGVQPRFLRIKPATIKINGFEVPEPMRVEPQFHSVYWTPYVYSLNELACAWTWIGSESEKERLRKGICHTTKEAAEAHAKALLSFTEVQP